MPDTPNFRFYQHPRFSANQIAEYLCTLDAPQREAVIRKAKFPKNVALAAYRDIVPPIRSFLGSNTGDLSRLDGIIQSLKGKKDHPSEYVRDEARRCLAMIDSLKETVAKAKLLKSTFCAGPHDLRLNIEGVSINVRLDASISDQNKNGDTFEGGCVLIMTASLEGRKDIEARTKTTAGVIHWAIENQKPNASVAPRLCASFDVHGRDIIRASDSYVTLRRRIESSCREAVGWWDRVHPPEGYDGPDWR